MKCVSVHLRIVVHGWVEKHLIRAVVVAQLAEQALPPATEVTGSNLHSGNLVEHLFVCRHFKRGNV